jgi:hypothetical protein
VLAGCLLTTVCLPLLLLAQLAFPLLDVQVPWWGLLWAPFFASVVPILLCSARSLSHVTLVTLYDLAMSVLKARASVEGLLQMRSSYSWKVTSKLGRAFSSSSPIHLSLHPLELAIASWLLLCAVALAREARAWGFSLYFFVASATLALFGLGIADALNLQPVIPDAMTRPYQAMLRHSMKKGLSMLPSLVPGGASVEVPTAASRARVFGMLILSELPLWGLNLLIASAVYTTVRTAGLCGTPGRSRPLLLTLPPHTHLSLSETHTPRAPHTTGCRLSTLSTSACCSTTSS